MIIIIINIIYILIMIERNRGTGAGGANTNKNGLKFENDTEITEVIKEKNNFYNTYKISCDISLKKMKKKTSLHKYLKSINEMNINIKIAHGCKQPDECYIYEDKNGKDIFIIEKKFQNSSGSVCEKIQTGIFKKEHYKKLFPNYNIHYIYVLSDWFKINCESEIEYLQESGIPIFLGNKNNYITDIREYMLIEILLNKIKNN